MPDGWSWEEVNDTEKFAAHFTKQVYATVGSFYEASRVARVGLIRTKRSFEDFLLNDSVSERALAALSRDLIIDRCLIFWFFRRHELKEILGLPDPHGSSTPPAGGTSGPAEGNSNSGDQGGRSQARPMTNGSVVLLPIVDHALIDGAQALMIGDREPKTGLHEGPLVLKSPDVTLRQRQNPSRGFPAARVQGLFRRGPLTLL